MSPHLPARVHQQSSATRLSKAEAVLLMTTDPLKALIIPHCPDEPHLGPPLGPPLTSSGLHLSPGLGPRCPWGRTAGAFVLYPLRGCPRPPLGCEWRVPAQTPDPHRGRRVQRGGTAALSSGAARGPRCRSPASLPPLHSNDGAAAARPW